MTQQVRLLLRAKLAPHQLRPFLRDIGGADLVYALPESAREVAELYSTAAIKISDRGLENRVVEALNELPNRPVETWSDDARLLQSMAAQAVDRAKSARASPRRLAWRVVAMTLSAAAVALAAWTLRPLAEQAEREVLPIAGENGSKLSSSPHPTPSHMPVLRNDAPPADVVVDGDRDGWPASEDCDDNDADVHPEATEVCDDDIDNDCDGNIKQSRPWFLDRDGDNFGGDTLEERCEPAGRRWVAVSGDCDDDQPAISPRAEEVPDGLDNDCDGLVDCEDPDLKCETCGNGIDDDQDGLIDCRDTDCPPCEEQCENGQDDDFDGKIDCNDPECASNQACS